MGAIPEEATGRRMEYAARAAENVERLRAYVEERFGVVSEDTPLDPPSKGEKKGVRSEPGLDPPSAGEKWDEGG
jgi:hypothetical protein